MAETATTTLVDPDGPLIWTAEPAVVYGHRHMGIAVGHGDGTPADAITVAMGDKPVTLSPRSAVQLAAVLTELAAGSLADAES
ncbi:hypothetical protein [Tsukamurella pseudospumae]|uniref:Uncharacterized protein n=1 Tax=Tsukamurella pseudospumae TaxID=239498 RepID=A0A138AU03_9ACTN|nr:hypothetical protein [Tsukamurella pseudospumae]KXP13931.1 hypothetical protein AXK60_22775 [Tsukamurella pseudospumae]